MSETKHLRTQQEVTRWQRLFRVFFAWYAVLGVALLAAAYMLEFEVCQRLGPHPKLQYLCTIAQYLANSIGLALLVASVFSFSIESASFLDYMKGILVRIVVSKDFLRNLSLSNKREAMELILKPSDDQASLASQVEEYFKQHIDQSMHLFEKNFKSSGNLNLRATYEDDNPVVRVYEDSSYTIHRTEPRFLPLKFGFEDSRSKLIDGEYVIPNEPGRPLKEADFKGTPRKAESGLLWNEFTYELPDDVHNHPYISIHMRYIEYGQDHWQLIVYRSMSFMNGLNVSLLCERDLRVKGYMIFDVEKNYTVTLSPDSKDLRIRCSQWIQPGRGLCILVAKENSTQVGVASPTAKKTD